MGDLSATDAAAVDDADRLADVLRSSGPLVVAYSGGVDSALLARVAFDTLGPEAMVAVTAVSPSLPKRELDEARAAAESWGMPWQSVSTDELSDDAYVRNDADRCARCKDALLDELDPIALDRGATVALGVNIDDLGDHRPGQEAAAARGAVFPLVEAGLDKEAVRALSRRLGLATAEKPAAACLASRLPYGTTVTLGRLRTVEAAEDALHRLGFTELRVRHYGDLARLEVPLDRLAEVVDRRDAVVAAVQAAGYRYVTLDLEGLRSGNLNAALGISDGAASASGPRR